MHLITSTPGEDPKELSTVLDTTPQLPKECHGGVLSQTLASSPCIKTILSARIRNPLLNDVVMVGHSSIRLHEFIHHGTEGRLSPPIADLELGVRILSAKVISAEECKVSTESAIFENGREEIRYRIRSQPWDETQPPQIVVLSTASSELVFVYARVLLDGTAQFVYARRTIMGKLHGTRKYGRQLAVDTESRVLAFTSAKGPVGIMSLKDVDHIKTEIDGWDPRNPASMNPSKQLRFINVDGMVLRMEFLSGPDLLPDRIILLLIVANQGHTRLLLYGWNTWQPLTTMKPLRCSGQALPQQDAFPHLLIPFCIGSCFAIVTDTEVVFYSNPNATRMDRTSRSVGQYKDKQWVQYVRPVRHADHKKKSEDIWLISEDGLLLSIIVTHRVSSYPTVTWGAGYLNINVDTAVCTFNAPLEIGGGDILIACGDATEGGVYQVRARAMPILLQILTNWSPINDLVHLEQKSTLDRPFEHGTVLAATGIHHDRAYLTEFRHGIEAEICLAFEHDEGATIDGLWVLERSAEQRLLLLASHHEHTTVLDLELQTRDIAFVDSTVYPRLSFDCPTLAACRIPSDAVLQITTQKVNLLGPSVLAEEETPNFLTGNFICADANTITGIFVAATRQEDGIYLVGGIAVSSVETGSNISLLPSSHRIDYVPVSLVITSIAGHNFCLAGSQDGHLHLHFIDPQHGFGAPKTWSLTSSEQSLEDARVSSICVLSMATSNSALVVCGLKTGRILFFDLSMKSLDSIDSMRLSLDRSHFLGTTAVTVRADSASTSAGQMSAYVICGSTLSHIQLYSSKNTLDYTVDNILIKNSADQTYNPAHIAAVNRVPRLTTDPYGLSGLLICVAGKEMVLAGMGKPSLSLRAICRMHSTKHLIYSSRLKRCVTSVQGSVDAGSETSQPPKSERPSLWLYDPNSIADSETALLKSRFFLGEKGEKIRVLLNWAPTDGRYHYDMIVIGSDHGSTGRLHYMSATRMAQPKPGDSAKLVARYPNKSISAICAYGMSSLVVCVNRDLKLMHLIMATKQWILQDEFQLPSKAIEMRTKGSVIYVATSKHSFMLIKEDGGKLQLIGSDQFADKARNIIPYGDGSTLVNLVSDAGSRILNFAQRPTRGARPTFEATLPYSVDRFIQLNSSLRGDKRDRFLGSTIDGTVLMFTTLTKDETSLLEFLQQLSKPIGDQATKDAAVLAHNILKKHGSKLESAGIAASCIGSTHANGDTLKALLEPGSHNLESLMRRSVKLEDVQVKVEDEVDTLTDLARPVLGFTADVVDSVTAWLRRLLNVPAF